MSRQAQVGIGSAIAAIAVIAFATLGGTGTRPEQVQTMPYIMAVALLIVGVLFFVIMPWATRQTQAPSNRPALVGFVCGLLAFVTTLGFWSGLPFVFGAGGAMLGQIGRERAPVAGHRRLALGAVALSTVGIVLSLGLLVADKITNAGR